MVEKRKRSKRLSQIMQTNKYFDRAVESYIDQLRIKRDWSNLENKMNKCKDSGWDKEKIRKIFQWERRACELYNKALDKSMDLIRHMASEISDEDFEELGQWIRKNSHSKDAWNKNVISIEDPLPLIKAKIMHLAYMSRSPQPVNIGEIINKEE